MRVLLQNQEPSKQYWRMIPGSQRLGILNAVFLSAGGRKDRLEAHHTREPKVVFNTIKQMSEQEWNEMTGTETKELNSVKEIN